MKPRLLLLGGIDPSGGAGLTVDAVVAASHGCEALPVVTAWTVQNRHRFALRQPLPHSQWSAAFVAAVEDGDVNAIKVGMLGDDTTVALVAAALRPWVGRAPIVVDPVLVSTATGPGASPVLATAYREHLLPIASVLLPNHPELAAICGSGGAGRAFAAGCAAVLAKDGHGDGDVADDVLLRPGREPHHFRRRRLVVGSVRGTGCALATAIAAHLAGGSQLEDACRLAGDWVHTLLQNLGPAPADGLPRRLPLAGAPVVRRTST